MAKVLKTTLRGPGTFSIDVVGEYCYQENLWTICGPPDKWRGESKRVNAELISEPGNPHDANAIRVQIDGLKVGHLDRERALKLSKQLRRKGFDSLHATCLAMIAGGRANRHIVIGGTGTSSGDATSYQVKLDIYTHGEQRAAKQQQATADSEPSREPGLVFSISECDTEQTTKYKSNLVNFWSPHDDPSKIFVFQRGGVGGESKLGLVPQTAFHVVRRKMDEGLPIEAEIISASSGTCKIRCRFVTQAELDRQHADERSKILAELSKTYRPKKLIKFSMEAPKGALQIGEKLEITKIPTAEQLASSPYSAPVCFRSVRTGDTFEKENEVGFMKKLVRLHRNCEKFDVKVVAENREYTRENTNGPGYFTACEYEVELVPEFDVG